MTFQLPYLTPFLSLARPHPYSQISWNGRRLQIDNALLKMRFSFSSIANCSTPPLSLALSISIPRHLLC